LIFIFSHFISIDAATDAAFADLKAAAAADWPITPPPFSFRHYATSRFTV
jgi:hypothetical protein